MTEPIDDRLRKLITEQNVLTDTYKAALGTIVEQREHISNWERRSREWCRNCDKDHALKTCEAKCQETLVRLEDQRAGTMSARRAQMEDEESRRRLTLLLVDARSLAASRQEAMREHEVKLADCRSLLGECLLYDMQHLPHCSYAHPTTELCDCGLYTLVRKIDTIVNRKD